MTGASATANTSVSATKTARKRQLVTFEVAGERFAADIFVVERVLRYTPPRTLPNAAGWLRGVIEHAGTVVPVIDLRERLGFDLAPVPEGARTLVIEGPDGRVGVIVDAVHAVRAVDATAIEAPPPIYRGLAKDYLEGIVREGDVLLVVLATAKLLTSTERLEMARAIAQGAASG